ncbi:unnamed protein product [Trypanosoma congolense IL3000]|uniref:WGS project CAEQ00000000 data, annotated contig 2080 n=1 Tax=Trypanosoma congolense (strain IL3000) TaxID=1068625 RepID=F9WBA1_TRYCI|nr:unnamed protein product [Trypanosoma congolense IL3000]
MLVVFSSALAGFSRRIDWTLTCQRRFRISEASHTIGVIDLCSKSNTGLACVWNETDNWCSLCCEPVNSWNEHRGKRDHICLEMFYNAIVQFGRRWSPTTLWWEVEECALLRRCEAPRPLQPFDQDVVCNRFVDFVCAPTENKGGVSLLMGCYDRAEHYTRRLGLHACLRHLVDNGVVRTDRASLSGGASFHGSLVTFKELFPGLFNMFPFADAKEISALTQMIASTYNSETVFDLCNFQQLFSVGMEQGTAGTANDNDARGLQSVSHGTGQGGGDASPANASGENSFHLKGVFCRGVMGQLRWALECDSVACPLQGACGCHRELDPYWQVLSEHTCRALLAEMVFCRVSEYIVRVEGVWRRRGALPGGLADETHPRRLSNWGHLQYMGAELFDETFGGRLLNEGAPKKLPTVS